MCNTSWVLICFIRLHQRSGKFHSGRLRSYLFCFTNAWQMNVTRHGKPSRAFTGTLRAPTSDDYDLLVHSAVEAIVGGSTDVLVSFAYTLKFPDSFPRGILVEKTESGGNVHRIKAKRLLKWLGDNGYTDITTTSLWGQSVSFGLLTTKLDNMFDIDIDNEL